MLLSINAESSQHREVGWNTAPGRTLPGTTVLPAITFHPIHSPCCWWAPARRRWHLLQLPVSRQRGRKTAPPSSFPLGLHSTEENEWWEFYKFAYFSLSIIQRFCGHHPHCPPPCFHHLPGEGASSTM